MGASLFAIARNERGKAETVNSGVDNVYSRVVEVEAWGEATGSPSANIQWLVPDHLGTPRIILDQTGAFANVKRHDYLPFGEELYAGAGGRTTAMGYVAGDGVSQQFISKERDNETGLDHFLARYYSSTQGRFTSPDEFTGGPDELFYFADDASENPTFYADLRKPQSLNKYQYSYSNPLRWVDPALVLPRNNHPATARPEPVQSRGRGRSRGRGNQKDTGLRDKSDADVGKGARDRSLPKAEDKGTRKRRKPEGKGTERNERTNNSWS